MKNKLKIIAKLLLLVAVSSYTIGCNKTLPGTITTATDTITIPPSDTTKTIPAKTYLALGDSYTIGQSVDSSQRYPAQTAYWLANNGITTKSIKYIATTGWTTIDLQTAIANANSQGSFDMVSLLIGVNDQYRGYDTGGYTIRFAQLLQKSIQLAGNKPNHVFVLSIPDYSVTPFANGSNKAQISQQIDNFNAINKRITSAFACNYLYITDSTRLAATDPTLIANDGLHPSGKEYKVWSNLLGRQIKAVF